MVAPAGSHWPEALVAQFLSEVRGLAFLRSRRIREVPQDLESLSDPQELATPTQAISLTGTSLPLHTKGIIPGEVLPRTLSL